MEFERIGANDDAVGAGAVRSGEVGGVERRELRGQRAQHPDRDRPENRAFTSYVCLTRARGATSVPADRPAGATEPAWAALCLLADGDAPDSILAISILAISGQGRTMELERMELGRSAAL